MESMENYRKIITSSRDGWSPYTVDTDSILSTENEYLQEEK